MKQTTEIDHQWEILYKTKAGRTYAHREGEHIQVEFGNVQLTLDSQAGLLMLREFVRATDLNDPTLYQPYMRRKLVLEVRGNSACYCFTPREFEEFRELLEGTLAMQELQAVIDRL